MKKQLVKLYQVRRILYIIIILNHIILYHCYSVNTQRTVGQCEKIRGMYDQPFFSTFKFQNMIIIIEYVFTLNFLF